MTGHVFLILLRERTDAERIRERLRAAYSPADGAVARFLVPDDPLRGDAFVSTDAHVQSEVARWWGRHVDSDASLGDHPRVIALVECAPQSGGNSVFNRLAGARFEIDDVARISGDAQGDALCDLVLDTYENRPDRPGSDRLFRPVAAGAQASASHNRSLTPSSGSWQPPVRTPVVGHDATEEGGANMLPHSASSQGGRTLVTPSDGLGRHPKVARLPRRSIVEWATERALGFVGRGPRGIELGRHAQWLMHPDYRAPVILVTNPKGGPGKTTTAIGIALILNEILEAAHANGRVVLVDGNTRMSDTFRSMPVADGAPTVREVTTLLRRSPHQIGEMQYANSRARNLVVLREQEDSGGYQLPEIEDLARYLREHFCAIVVDLVNDRPGTGSPTERLVQWWMTQAHVLVIPAKAHINDLEGAERMVAARQGLPVVLAYIQPPQRDLDMHPRIRERLERLRPQVASMHTIPEDYRVRTAALDNLNLVDAARCIREAFAELTLGVLAVHADEVYRKLCAGLTPTATLDPMALP
jgi:MinD-like ATPase involved in chromosome partitioning or flagellar assembly